jgi:ketosteroid isomerase-like protein
MKRFASLLLMSVLGTPGAWAQTPAGPEQALLNVETAWSQAAVNRDRARLEPFYADEYIFTNEDGLASNKAKEIADITSGTFRLTSFRFSDLKVHLYGAVALVTGQNTITGRWEDIGKDISGPYRFTDVFVKRSGRWQCVASQSSRVTPSNASGQTQYQPESPAGQSLATTEQQTVTTAQIKTKLDELVVIVNELVAEHKSMRKMMATHAGMMTTTTTDSPAHTSDDHSAHHSDKDK